MDSMLSNSNCETIPETRDRKRSFRSQRGLTTAELLMWIFVAAVVILGIFVFVRGPMRDKVVSAVCEVIGKGPDCK